MKPTQIIYRAMSAGCITARDFKNYLKGKR